MDGRIVRSTRRHFADWTVLQPLVIARFVEMPLVLRASPAQGHLPNEDHLPQALFLDRANEYAFKLGDIGGSLMTASRFPRGTSEIARSPSYLEQ